jgi:hypothetical protein
MANIAWNENVPSDGSKAGIGAQQARAVFESIQVGLQESLDFPFSAHLKPGASRMFVGPESDASLPGSSTFDQYGAAMFLSDNSRVISWFNDALLAGGGGSAATVLTGTPRFIEKANLPPDGGVWISESSQRFITTPTAAGETITLADMTGYDNLTIHVTSSNTKWQPNVKSIAASSFIVAFDDLTGGSGSDTTLNWWISASTRNDMTG